MYKIISRAGSLVISRNTRLLGISTDRKYSAGNDRNESGCKNHSLLLPSLKTDMASCSSVDEPKHTNRLAQEKSPYLLQHAHNPVDWYPWGEEAIQKAKAENKLIFLSVGYSTCHWCHVMEHESFENEEVAKIMNENFVNIKVDREERPDIDKIYMNFVLMINGSGGWPMSVWLTPDLAPITAGTYFPPMDRWGMPGFKTVLKKIAEKWRNNKTELAETGHKIIQAIQKSLAEKGEEQSPDGPLSSEDKLNQAIRIFKRNFDSDYGGFGSHPKFPEVSRLNFLFHAYVVKKDRDILNMVLKTLTKIGNGGIHDHVFGGFARYSVDQRWHVPHFEKMLYDQGQLLSAYAHAYKITNDEKYLNIADGIFRYLIKDLRHPSGGFYSGEDADSLATINDKVKIEGAFYAWTYSEIRDAIKKNSAKFEIEPQKAFEIYSYHYNVQESGNVEPSSDPHGHLTAKNILIVRKSAEATCEKFKITHQQFDKVLSTTNEILHEIRDKRPRPHLDTKIITAWNGLILSGLSRLANCVSEKRGEYITAAKDLVNFLRTFSYDKEKKIVLRTCYGKGTGSEITEVLSDPIGGFLDDYAFLIKGLLDYYKATFDMDALEWAKELQDIQDLLFWDERQGGYFYSQENSPNVIVRLKEDHDGAEPCGNSVAARNLQLIAVYYEDKSYKERAKKLFEFFSTASPFGYVLPEMMSALLVYERGLEMAAIVGPNSDLTRSLIDVCRKYYIPGIVVVHFDPDKNSFVKRKTLEKFKMINGKPTAYICHNKVCQLPLTDPETLEEKLKSSYVLD